MEATEQSSQFQALPMLEDTPSLLSFMKSEVDSLVKQISYDGMDPKHIRELTKKACKGDAKVLMKWLTMYVHWGSKFYQKDKASRDSVASQKAIASLKEAGVFENKKEGKLTLSRIAAAHAPLTCGLRKLLLKIEDLPASNVDEPDLPMEYHDLALACYSGTRDRFGNLMKSYLKKFALILHNAAVKDRRSGKLSDDEVYEEMEKYRLAAVSSLVMDSANNVDVINVTATTMLVRYGYKAV